MNANKNAPAGAKVIEWAFLCTSAQPGSDNGWNITNLNNSFDVSSLPVLVFRVCVPGADLAGIDGATRQTYRRFTDFQLGIIIKTDTKEDVDAQSADLYVSEQIRTIPIGQSLLKPGHYTVEVRVDGALQHSLDLFLR